MDALREDIKVGGAWIRLDGGLVVHRGEKSPKEKQNSIYM